MNTTDTPPADFSLVLAALGNSFEVVF